MTVIGDAAPEPAAGGDAMFERLARVDLHAGAHSSPEPDSGTGKVHLCLLETVAYLKGIDHTDHPPCVSPFLASMGRAVNDLLPDRKRHSLLPLAPFLIGTAGDPEHDELRVMWAAEWAVNTLCPLWLHACGFDDEAETLASLRSPEFAVRSGPPDQLNSALNKLRNKNNEVSTKTGMFYRVAPLHVTDASCGIATAIRDSITEWGSGERDRIAVGMVPRFAATLIDLSVRLASDNAISACWDSSKLPTHDIVWNKLRLWEDVSYDAVIGLYSDLVLRA